MLVFLFFYLGIFFVCLGLHSAVSPFFPFHFCCSAIGFRRVFRQSAQKAQRHEKSISIDLFFSFCSLPRSKSFFSNSCKISATPILLLTLISVAPSPSDKRRDDSSAHAHTHTHEFRFHSVGGGASAKFPLFNSVRQVCVHFHHRQTFVFAHSPRETLKSSSFGVR